MYGYQDDDSCTCDETMDLSVCVFTTYDDVLSSLAQFYDVLYRS